MPAAPFRVFDQQYIVFADATYVYCIRCEDWIPWGEAYGGYVDPHIFQHVEAWRMLQNVDTVRELMQLTGLQRPDEHQGIYVLQQVAGPGD